MKNHIRSFAIRILLTVIAFLIIGAVPGILKAQDKTGIVTGSIIDKSSGAPVEGADVTINRVKDSSLVKGTATDASGKFIISDVPFGRYYLKANLVGYNLSVVSGITINPNSLSVTLDPIKLSTGTTTIDEIVVESEKSSIEFKPDKKVFNVGKDITNLGNTLIDLLKEIPSVTVDQDGNISLRGGEGVKILIDGRPFGLEGSNRNSILQQIPASSVESIELISNPSAKFEAEGSSGILNVIMKKNVSTNIGINGNISINIGNGDKYNGLTSVGLKNNKVNLFANYNYSLFNFVPSGFNDRTNYISNTEFNLTNSGNSRNNSHLVKTGMDYFINKLNAIGFSLTYQNSKTTGLDFSSVKETDFSNNLIADYSSSQNSNNKSNTFDLNLNYKMNFKSPSRNLTSDFTYSRNNENNEDFNLYSYTFPVIPNPQNTKTLQDEKNDDFSGQIDYVHPFNKDIKLETGFKSGYKRRDTDYNLSNFDYSSNNYVSDFGQSNRFVYNENVQGLYGIYTQQLGSFGYSVGLRAELTYTKGELKNNGQTFDKNYFDVFPSASISQKISSKNEIQLSYTRRINRPRPRQLNPFLSVRGANNFFIGNPDLIPEYTDSYELSYIHFLPFLTITPTIFYRQTKDEIARTRTLKDSTSTVVTFVNYGKTKSYGGELLANINPVKFWSLNGTFSYYRREVDATNISSNFSNNGSVWSARFLSTLMLPMDFSLGISYFYSGKRIVAQGYFEPFQSLDASLKKDFFDKKLSLTLKVSDIMDNLAFKGVFNDVTFSETLKRKRDSRTFFLNITYNFGERDKKQQDRRKNKDRDSNDSDIGF